MEHTKINIEIGYQDTTDDGSWCDRWTEDYSGPHKYWTFPVTVAEVVPIETIAEAAFIADNSPYELTAGAWPAASVKRCWTPTGRPASGTTHCPWATGSASARSRSCAAAPAGSGSPAPVRHWHCEGEQG